MSDREVRQAGVLLAMFSAIILVLALSLGYIGSGMPFAFEHQRKLLWLYAVVTSILVLAILLSCWYLLLFAVQVRLARFRADEVVIERFFAPEVRIPALFKMKKIGTPVPSLNVEGYQQGVLFVSGMSSFFVPGSLQDAELLIDYLSSNPGVSR
ncbi:MAG: hypothetical protein K2P57_07000 [Burkholderiales bacterium]|nr:hypothetical protein [Burkholderiales bacterium]